MEPSNNKFIDIHLDLRVKQVPVNEWKPNSGQCQETDSILYIIFNKQMRVLGKFKEIHTYRYVIKVIKKYDMQKKPLGRKNNKERKYI
ncbi:hypothetical protein ACF0H5_001834 [Mactra antiquata]